MPLTEDEVFDESFYEIFPELAGQIERAGQNIFGFQPLSPAERTELRSLEGQEARLQPIPMAGDQPSTRIAGNPYSYDISPVTEGLQNILVGVLNKKRQEKLLGDPEQAAELAGQAKTAQSAARDTRGTMSDIRGGARANLRESQDLTGRAREAGGVMGRLQDLRERELSAKESEDATRQLMATLLPSLANRQFDAQTEEARMRSAAEIEKELLDYRQQLEQQEEEDGDFNPSTVNNYFRTLGTGVQLDIMGLENMMEQYQQLSESERTADQSKLAPLARSIDNQYQKIVEKNNELARLMETMGLVPNVGQQGGQLPGQEDPTPTGEGEPDNPTSPDNPNPPPAEESNTQVISQGQLQEWADEFTGGNVEQARQILSNRGVTIQ